MYLVFFFIFFFFFFFFFNDTATTEIYTLSLHDALPILGAWPIDQERCWQYMLKACREAKIKTSWHEPNTGYEENIRGFVDGVFQTPEFIASLEAFIQPLVLPGRINSLSQTLIKMI